VLAGGVAAALTGAGLAADGLFEPDVWSAARGLVVGSYVAVGAYSWARRPASRFGPLLAAAGLLYAVASLTASQTSVVHTAGRVFFAAFVVYLAYAFLCFPRGRLASDGERRLVAGLAAATALTWLVALPLVSELPAAGPLADCPRSCPANAFQLASTSARVTSAIDLAVNAVSAAGLLGVIAVLARKARSPSRLRRRLVNPLLVSAICLALTYVAFTLLRQGGLERLDALRVLGAAAALGVPLGMLVGQVRGRMFATTRLVRLVARVGREAATPAAVEALLRDALGDPRLRLAVHGPRPGTYVDAHGRPVELPLDRPDLSVTQVSRNGRPVASLVHDAALDDDPRIAEGLAATALMLLDHAQLVEELRASRARVVASAQRERLRLERDLHDGAQQRLFSIQLKLADARAAATDPQQARDLDELAADAAAAVDELRALAHGIYPTVLRERGLAAGLRSLARRATVPVEVADRGIGRCTAAVEEAVYFCVHEAIQNVAKHGGKQATVTVTLGRSAHDLTFTVEDDGVGFDPERAAPGVGTVSMQDRLGAVGGELRVEAAPGSGTSISGVVPVG